ncbi:alkaline phosphatase D family protein [Thalassotalea euphylliae]|uniref:alkaline phosphatase D family protein n=1 Tax=Thalassotalea euphylliae TaxID=1655234 RepID=UPI001FE24691|nr:alkaline phosphatase family protein [Thalassotalea euphylliae]
MSCDKKRSLINLPHSLPALLAGPILRDCHQHQFTLWLATKAAYQFHLELTYDQGEAESTQVLFSQQLTAEQYHQIPVGQQCFINVIDIKLTQPLPTNALIHYDLTLISDDGEVIFSLGKDLPELSYSTGVSENTVQTPSFAIKPDIRRLYHGSCRKPHFAGKDSLVELDHQLATSEFSAEQRPSLLMLSGDQVYIDDVAGPMLIAIHQLIEKLGLFDESWQLTDEHCLTSRFGSSKNSDKEEHSIHNSEQLFHHPLGYYQREQLLPHSKASTGWKRRLFGARRLPIFSSVNAKNHLVTLSEMIAMYLLTWSPTLWALVDIPKQPPANIPPENHQLYLDELQAIEDFIEGLSQVRRAMAHVPVYMIFDDHDITDDWNLTRGWEEAAYGNPFSKRIIGNALVAYYLCQGLGNQTHRHSELIAQHSAWFTEQGVQQHDQLVDTMLAFDQWHYHLPTSPKMLVLDTRTQRWRSESNAGKPSGLMDWESLTELQQQLIHEPSVILVSAAPIYGVKLIETVQRVFTFFGNPLAVDAENWMAHRGTANVMLNIFRNRKTPPQFIILSGDVHYSFVYDVSHRFIRSSSSIVQITCSGIKNAFPPKLLHTLERLNYYLYGRYSPLNWFTKRRRMRIRVRRPSVAVDKTLYNGCGIGVLELNADASEVTTRLLIEGGQQVNFKSPARSSNE